MKVENSLEIVEIYCTLSRHVNHYRLLFANGANNFDQMRVAFSFVVFFFCFFFQFSSDVVEECVFVRYTKDGKLHTSFASLEKPATVDAEGIANSILNAIKVLNHTNVSHED